MSVPFFVSGGAHPTYNPTLNLCINLVCNRLKLCYRRVEMIQSGTHLCELVGLYCILKISQGSIRLERVAQVVVLSAFFAVLSHPTLTTLLSILLILCQRELIFLEEVD